MKKSYYCAKLEKTLHFLPNSVKFCCSCAEGAGIKINDFSKFDEENLITEKEKYINVLKSGYIPRECNGCVEYKEITIKDRLKSLFKKAPLKKVEHIIIDHYKQCDCACVYCSQVKIYGENKQKYEILPIIKKLYEKNMIDLENLKVEFQGGNISLLSEFDDLMLEFSNNGCNDFVILMNGIKYIPTLEKIGSNEKSHICISLDSGTRETFKKIKKVDGFDSVIANIKKLREKSKAQLSLKYIIVQGINDNEDELKSFLELAKEIGNINPVCLEIDYNNTLLNQGVRFDVPIHYYDLFYYAEKFCEDNNMNFVIYPYTKSILDRGYSI